MPKKKQSAATLRQQALERENLRLQRKVATLEAKLVSARNELLLRPPYTEPDKSLTQESVTSAFRKLAARAKQQTPTQN